MKIKGWHLTAGGVVTALAAIGHALFQFQHGGAAAVDIPTLLLGLGLGGTAIGAKGMAD